MVSKRPGGLMQTAYNKFATGKKVYAQGSHAPTKGTVNPTGYIQRELKKRGLQASKPGTNHFGTPKPSQTRSGLAANALKNQPAKKAAAPVRQPVQLPGRAPVPGTDRLPGAGDRRSDGGGDPFAPAKEYTPPSWVDINTNGQLDLPYDESFSWDMLSQKERMNQQLIDLFGQEQQQGLEYAQLKRDAEQGFTKLNRDTLNDASGRGMAFSSLYGNAVAENSNKYNQFLGDLEAGNALFKGNINMSRAALENAFNDYLRRSALDQAMQLQDDAGDLGFGESEIDNSYDDIQEDKAPAKKTAKKTAKKSIKKPTPAQKKAAQKKGRPGNHPLSKQNNKPAKKAAAKKAAPKPAPKKGKKK